MQGVRHLARVDDRHHEYGAEATDELRDPVRHHVARRESACDRETGAYRGIEVPARDVTERGDRERETEPEPRGDAEWRDRVDADVYDDRDSAEAEEEEEEGAEGLGNEPYSERLIHRPTSRLRFGPRFCNRQARFLRCPSSDRRERERATGLEPVTSSLEGWRSTN